MAFRPIKLRLDGEELHIVPSRELQRWGGYLHGRRSAWELVTPDNVADIRRALIIPRGVDTHQVFVELAKQLEDASALFFEVPPTPVQWDSPDEIDIHDLIPDGGDDDGVDPTGPSPQPGLHWIEVVCISASGGSYVGSNARLRLPDGRTEVLALDGNSSVRIDDLTEGGTVHFELSGDAVARGTLDAPQGTRYELGGSVGLVTRRRHVLIVHPNPRAFVSVELLVGDDPINVGRYTLTTAAGEQAGDLLGEPVRADGFALPSASSYAFEGVILPPRDSENGNDGEDGDESGEDGGENGGDVVEPTGPLGPGGTEPDRITLILEDEEGTPLRNAEVRILAGGQEFLSSTDGTGNVVFADLPAGVEEVEARLVLDSETLPEPQDDESENG